ncbi:hypothetical protein AN1V17_03090 [Vallitalea sediminicola]
MEKLKTEQTITTKESTETTLQSETKVKNNLYLVTSHFRE